MTVFLPVTRILVAKIKGTGLRRGGKREKEIEKRKGNKIGKKEKRGWERRGREREEKGRKCKEERSMERRKKGSEGRRGK